VGHFRKRTGYLHALKFHFLAMAGALTNNQRNNVTVTRLLVQLLIWL